MPEGVLRKLSRRERELMEVLYRRGEGSVQDVREELADPPGYSAVRTQLRILEEKGFVLHREEGRKYIYRPSVAKAQARASALRDLLGTFFGGSVTAAVSALLTEADLELDDQEMERLEKMVRKARARRGG